MIKMKARTKEGLPLIILGYSFANLDRFRREDSYTRIDLREFGIEAEIVTFAGESEEAMIAALGAVGLIPDEALPSVGDFEPGKPIRWDR